MKSTCASQSKRNLFNKSLRLQETILIKSLDSHETKSNRFNIVDSLTSRFWRKRVYFLVFSVITFFNLDSTQKKKSTHKKGGKYISC